MRRLAVRFTVTALTGVAGVAIGGCGGSGRSTTAFCHTMLGEQHAILQQFHATAASGGSGRGLAQGLAEFGASVQAISALRTYYDKLSDVAPPPIEDQAKIVAQSYDQELHDAASEATDPFGALASGLMTSMDSSSQLDDMNTFALHHCGHSI